MSITGISPRPNPNPDSIIRFPLYLSTMVVSIVTTVMTAHSEIEALVVTQHEFVQRLRLIKAVVLVKLILCMNGMHGLPSPCIIAEQSFLASIETFLCSRNRIFRIGCARIMKKSR